VAKKKTSVSIEERVYERLQNDPHINVSALVNQLLCQYYSTGTADGLELRRKRIERDLARTREKESKLEEQLAELEDAEQQRQDEKHENIEQALENLSGIPGYRLTADNPGIVNQANKIGIPPEELLERLKEQRPNCCSGDR